MLDCTLDKVSSLRGIETSIWSDTIDDTITIVLDKVSSLRGIETSIWSDTIDDTITIVLDKVSSLRGIETSKEYIPIFLWNTCR